MPRPAPRRACSSWSATSKPPGPSWSSGVWTPAPAVTSRMEIGRTGRADHGTRSSSSAIPTAMPGPCRRSRPPEYDRPRVGGMTTIDRVRKFALGLPRTYEALVRDRVKFRVGRIVFLEFSRDETLMGFGFPKEEREALVASEPEKFMMPKASDLRYHWAVV